MPAVQRIQSTDSLETGFRNRYNATVDAIIDASAVTCDASGVLSFYNDRDVLLGSIDLSDYFKLQNESSGADSPAPTEYQSASEENEGLTRYATPTEALAGTQEFAAISPATLNYVLARLDNVPIVLTSDAKVDQTLKLVRDPTTNEFYLTNTDAPTGSGTGGGTGGTYTVLDDPRCYNLPILTILEDSIATAQIQIGAVTWERTDFVRPDINWFDKDSPFNQPGFYMNTKGELTANQAYVLSHRIPVTPLTTWTPNVPGQYVTYFNRAGKPIGGEDHARPNATFTTPAGVAFMRMTIPADLVNQFQVTPGAVNLDWQPFKRVFLGETPQQAQIASTARRAAGDLANFIVPGENLFRKDDSRNQPGAFIDNKGKVTGNASYQISHPIPVTPGQRYHPSSKQYVAFFSARDLPVGNGADYLRDDDAFTVPAGVAYILCTVPADQINTFRLVKGNVDKPEASALPIFQGTTPQSAQALNIAQVTQSALSRQTGDLAALITPATNLFNKDDVRNQTGKYITNTGQVASDAAYLISHPITVTPGQTYNANYKQFIAYFNALDQCIGGANVVRDDTYFTVPANTVYILCTVAISESDNFQVNTGTSYPGYSESVPTLQGVTPQGTQALNTAKDAQIKADDINRYLIANPNLYDRLADGNEDGKYIDDSGVEHDMAGYTIGPFQRVEPSTTYTATHKQFVAFFDELGAPVGGVSHTRSTNSFTTSAATVFIRPTLETSTKTTFQIVEGGSVPTSYTPFGRRTSMNLQISTYATLKRILLMGTSIPADSGYAEKACAELGAYLINCAVPSSSLRIFDKNGSRAGMYWKNCAYSLMHTTAEKLDLLANWSTYRTQFIDAATAPTSFTSEEAEFIRSCSFEARLVPYLTGEQPEVDLIIISHGYNDRFTNETEAEYVAIAARDPATGFSRNTFTGAMNYLLDVIRYYKPSQKVAIEGHYENQLDTRVALGQTAVAAYQQIPILKLWEYVPFSQRTIPNTASKWSQAPWNLHAADAESREPGSTSTDMKALRFFMPDNVHPYSDPTGQARDLIAVPVRNFINNLL
ncbi:hypothetical protein GGR92_005284 [Spirosoma lacussanchae]|uniref:hypothetical protein n=1 Tax=Spirosoma lacussanchae TaxID=1884249 RepID=UPI0011083626|nr:hypothetical protein [Spirosoma lacussanchae]